MVTLATDTKTAKPDDPNVTLEFDAAVDQYVVGMSFLEYEYDKRKDHHVKKIALEMGSSNSGSDVNVSVKMTMRDKSKNGLSNKSKVHVGGIASGGRGSGGVVEMVNDLKLQSGGHSSAVGLDNPTFDNLPIMAGFSTEFADNHHHVRGFSGSISVSSDQNKSVTLTGNVEMYDDSGHSAGGSLEGSYLGTFIEAPSGGLVVSTGSYNDYRAIKIEFADQLGDLPLLDAAVFVKSFTMTYDSDHHLSHIRVGATNVKVDIDEKTVKFTSNAHMGDEGGHHVDGKVELIVIGLTTVN